MPYFLALIGSNDVLSRPFDLPLPQHSTVNAYCQFIGLPTRSAYRLSLLSALRLAEGAIALGLGIARNNLVNNRKLKDAQGDRDRPAQP